MEIKNSKTPTISLTQFESSHSERRHYCSPNTPTILSPDSNVRIQKDDTTAHQKCRQSLLLDSKVRIQKDDTTVHQKRQQSLSPDSKVRIQKSNTAAQQKCRQSLSPDSKACIQETKVIEIDQTTEEFLREFFTSIRHCHWFIIPGGTVGYPFPPQINSSVCPSVSPSVDTF